MLKADFTAGFQDLDRPAASSHWLTWVLGIAIVAGVSFAALHFSEAEQIATIAEQARPSWLLVAILLQLATYVAQGEIWRVIARSASFSLSLTNVFRLSLAKLFIDQALPTAGLSGTAAVSKYFGQQGMAKPAVMASIVISLASYFAAYAVLLVSALMLLPLPGPGRGIVTLATLAFLGGCVVVVWALIKSADPRGRLTKVVSRFGPLRSLAQSLAESDPKLVRNRRVMLESCGYQAAIILLDAATIWALIHALGHSSSGVAVFASFMISNLFRTLGVLPGGLGTFETSSVLTLQLTGVPLPVALSATLLFRGMSFWLPMIPGLYLTRRMFSRPPEASRPERSNEPRRHADAEVISMYSRILVALDGSVTSLRGLHEAIRLAKASGARLLLLHVLNTLILETEIASTAYYQALAEEIRSSGLKIIEDASALAHDAGVSFEHRMIEKVGAHPWREIVAQAGDWHAELIVLGTHGRRGLKRLVLGSDAELVLRHSPVPVLMVRDRLTD